MTRPPGCRVDREKQEREPDRSRDNGGCELRCGAACPEAQDEHEVGGGEHDDPAAVGAEAGAADRHERQGGDGDSGAPEQRCAHERRHEQHRLEQVVDAVEPARLRWTEGRERDGLGVQPHRDEIRGEERRAGQPEGEHNRGEAGCNRDRRVEPQVRGERDQDGAECELRSHERQSDQQCGQSDRQRQAQAVVPVDPVVERLECLHRVVARDDLQTTGRDVRDRDEPVDPRRVGREETALAEHGDRIARVVLAPTRRRQRDENLRPGLGAELDQGPTGGDPTEEVVLELSPQESSERRFARHGRSCAGHKQPDGGPVRVVSRIERRDDSHSCLRGSGHGEREQDEHDSHPRDSPWAERASRIACGDSDVLHP